MKLKLMKITDKIYLIIFENQFDITSTFLRFQEHYESPKFRGKIFSLEEFKKWYVQNSREGKLTGKFTYHHDWSGFNVPSYVLTPFYEGKFNPLSSKEKRILDMFKKTEEPYYIIGIHKEMPHVASLLKHEIAHGLFYTNKVYKKEVLTILNRFDTKSIRKLILQFEAGYHEAVMDDETHAYTLASGIKLKSKEHKLMKKLLDNLYKKHINSKTANLPKLA